MKINDSEDIVIKRLRLAMSEPGAKNISRSRARSKSGLPSKHR